MPDNILPEIQKVAVAWGEAMHKLAMDIQKAVKGIVEEKDREIERLKLILLKTDYRSELENKIERLNAEIKTLNSTINAQHKLMTNAEQRATDKAKEQYSKLIDDAYSLGINTAIFRHYKAVEKMLDIKLSLDQPQSLEDFKKENGL